ncbi:hypothetical protein Tco_0538174 [Tanacetum coccineum]
MRKNYNNREDTYASENRMTDDMPMCERHEANYIQSEGYQNQNSHDSYSHQSHYDLNDSEKSLTELNNDVRNDLKHFKSCIRSMRTVHDKLFDRDDQSKKISKNQSPLKSCKSGKSDDPSKTQKDPPPPIIVNNKVKKDKPIKTSKKISCQSKRITSHYYEKNLQTQTMLVAIWIEKAPQVPVKFLEAN